MSTGERLPELIGTWRIVRWEDRDGGSAVAGGGTTWARAVERVR